MACVPSVTFGPGPWKFQFKRLKIGIKIGQTHEICILTEIEVEFELIFSRIKLSAVQESNGERKRGSAPDDQRFRLSVNQFVTDRLVIFGIVFDVKVEFVDGQDSSGRFQRC